MDPICAEWQSIVDILARICRVPSAIITRFCAPEIEVVTASATPDNPYREGLRVTMNGHYCEGIFRSTEKLRVEDATVDPQWHNAPEIKYGMVAYLGYPIQNPDQSLFGTLCVLDNKENSFSDDFEGLLLEFRNVIEAHLLLIEQKEELRRKSDEIQTLRGILPICMGCKRIRDDKGYWEQIECYISQHSDARFSHGYCPECAVQLFAHEFPDSDGATGRN